ncbi:hypothetical protein [Mycobacterium uberis]|nr:hypothetical protein [Mycobacterium uberis]
MCFAITLEPSAPLPEFLRNPGREKMIKTATEGLRDFVMNRDRVDESK